MDQIPRKKCEAHTTPPRRIGFPAEPKSVASRPRIIRSVFEMRYESAAGMVAGRLRSVRSRWLASAFWSAVTGHRFPEATCRRRTTAHVGMSWRVRGSRQRWGVRGVSLPCRPPTATSRLRKAVTSPRTPKHARVLPCSCVGCLAHPSRVSSESGSCRVSIRLGISTLQSVFECRPVGSLSRHLKGSAALQNSVYTGIHPELRSRTPRTTSQRGRGAAFTPLRCPMTRVILSPQTMRTLIPCERGAPLGER